MSNVTSAPPCAGGCGAPAETAHQRHATQAEYDALPEGLRPIDGVALIAVHTCGDCALPPSCGHPESVPAPCPVCEARPGSPCTKPDGTQRLVEHRERAATQPPRQECRHAHREDCDPQHCACTSDDPPPVRAPRIVGAAPAAPLPGMLLDAAAWMTTHGIDPRKVRSELRSGFTQDNRPAFLFDYVTAPDDGHGHEVVELRVEPVEIAAPHQG